MTADPTEAREIEEVCKQLLYALPHYAVVVEAAAALRRQQAEIERLMTQLKLAQEGCLGVAECKVERDRAIALSSKLALDVAERDAEIERLRVENWQLKGALGYEVPGHIPCGAFKCGLCEAKTNEITDLRSRLERTSDPTVDARNSDES